MRRRAFITLIGGATVAPLLRPLPLRAQQPAMPVIGLLTATNQTDGQLRALQQGLNEGGYVENRNLAMIYRSADNQFDRLPALAADLVARQVSVILALGSPVPARVAMAATKTIPIVFAYGGDPVSDNLVASFNRPGGNVTGATFIAATLTAKRLELLREITPRVTDVALLVSPNSTLAEIQIKDAESAAHILGQRLHVVNANSEAEVNAAFAAISQLKAGALLVDVHIAAMFQRDQFAALAARYKIPTIYPYRDYPVAGGLMSYGASMTDTWRQAGVYVGRILKGAKPADLPVVQPTKFELVINLKAAKALGLTVPNTLLVSAAEVIE